MLVDFALPEGGRYRKDVEEKSFKVGGKRGLKQRKERNGMRLPLLRNFMAFSVRRLRAQWLGR